MIIKHCGNILSPKERELKPTPLEEAHGIERVTVREYYCQGNACRKRLFYWDKGQGFARVRQHERSGLLRRLRLPRESDWVWGFDPETYAKKKVMVR